MSLPLVCPNLTDPVHCFDDNTRKPCIGKCGHTICLQCITFDELRRCPVCGLSGAFNKVSVNYTSIALIEACRNRFQEKLKGWADTKTRNAGFCLKLFEETQLLCAICVEPVKTPRICLTCDEEILFKDYWWEWRQNNAIVLKILQRVMCSDCALNNHEGHKLEKHNMDKKSKKLITMALAQNVLNMFRDTIENKKCVIDCFLRRLKIEIIGQNLLKLINELEYIEEWKCGYLGELVKKELIKKYMENVDEKMLDLFSIQGNSVCDCSRFHEDLETFSRESVDVEKHRLRGIKPQVFDSGCPLYSWKYLAHVRRRYSISGKEFSDVAATISPNTIDCPLCVYNGYSQHQKKDFFLENGVSIIEEICKTEMIPLDKCCLNCLDRLNDCQFFLSCEHEKKKPYSIYFTRQSKKQKGCYRNCFMKDSTLWNFVIINHMMADLNLWEVMMYEIEQTDGFVDCRLRKVRISLTVNELYEGLRSVFFWKYFDHLSKPIEMDALLESVRKQWNSFRFGHGEQEAASQCKCTVIWNKTSENKVEGEQYEDLIMTMVDMTRYSMTEELHGCPMEYNHGIKLNKDVMDELKDTVGFESTSQETKSTLAGDEQAKCLIKKIVSIVFPFAHLHCQNEDEQLFDNEIHKPYTGSCGHTICLVCIEKTPNGDCPVCGKKGSFEEHQLNEELVKEIETIKRNAWEMFKELWNSEAADSGTCSRCNKHSSDLHMCDIDILTIFYSGISIKTTADVLKLSRQIICQECAAALEHVPKKMDSIPFWKSHLKRTNGIFLLELLEDDIGENREHPQTRIQKSLRKLIRVWEEINYIKRGDCGYDRDLINIKLIGKLIENIDHDTKQLIMPEKNLFEPIKERNCPLCVMIDLLACAKNNRENNQNDWMNMFEHLWCCQSPRFGKCCTRCLLHLNNRYSALCQTKIEVMNIKRMSNAMSECIEKGQLKEFEGVLTSMDCNDYNYFVNDKQTWENLITREYFLCLLQTMTVGLSKTTFACYLRKIRIYKLSYHFLSDVRDLWAKNNSCWIVGERFIKASNMVKNLNITFKKLRSEMDMEEIGFKCKCTEIWKRNQKMIRKFGHEYCEEKRRHQDLEDSMEEMARFSLEEDLDGCPMDYDHGFILDEEIVKKLKESTDLEAETDKKKCLCVQIDSLEPNSSISGTNLHQIVPLFINWCKYESSYPHLLCHVCVDRLELIQELIWQLVLSNNWSSSVLYKLSELCTSVHDFQFTKGRVSKTDMEKMAKIIEDFVSEWDSLLLPPIQNGPERAVATAGNISQGRSREENTRPGSTEGQQ